MTAPVLTFGEFEGKTFEWLFFHAPWYARWMQRDNVLATRWDYDDGERAYFSELYRRASALKGICAYCDERMITRKALATWNAAHGTALGTASYCCDQCEPFYEGQIIYQDPSLFLRHFTWSRKDQKNLTSCIKNEFIIGGPGNLTQALMEEFFRDDEFFWYATANFFVEEEVAA